MDRPTPTYLGPDSGDLPQLQYRISNLPREISNMILEAYLQVEEQDPQVVTIRQTAGQNVTGIYDQPSVFRTYYSNGVPTLLHLTRATREKALRRYSLLFGGFGNAAKYFDITLDILLLSGVEDMFDFIQPQTFTLIRNLAVCERPSSIAMNLWGKVIHFRCLQKLTLERWTPPGVAGMYHWNIVIRELNDAWLYISQLQSDAEKLIAPYGPRLNLLTDVQIHQIAGIPFTSPH